MSSLEAVMQLQHVACNLCGRSNPKLLYVKRGMGTNLEFNVVICKSCGLLYVNPRLAPSSLSSLYDRNYFSTRFSDGDLGRFTSARVLCRGMRQLLSRRADQPLTLLDVGGGIGTLVRAAREEGFKAELVDISDSAIEIARQEGINGYHGELTDGYFDGKSYHVITALEVIEHCYDPKSFFRRVHELLRPGGIFFYTTGNAYETRFRGSRWVYFDEIPYHVYFYNSRTIRMYLQEAGFREYLDPYQFILNDCDCGVRMLSKLGIINPEKDTSPSSILARLGYRHAFRLIAAVLGRSKHPIARKSPDPCCEH